MSCCKGRITIVYACSNEDCATATDDEDGMEFHREKVFLFWFPAFFTPFPL